MMRQIWIIIVFLICILGMRGHTWNNNRITGTKIAREVSEGDKGDILFFHPKEKIVPVLSSFKWVAKDLGDSSAQANLTILWFSDLHSEWRRLLRISKFYKEYSNYIDGVFCTGDAAHTYGSFEGWGESGAASFINVIGNHECFGPKRVDGTNIIPGWTSPAYSPKECYVKFFRPFLHETNIVIPQNKCYFFKDYINYNIRIIGIDGYHWKETPRYENGTPIEVYPDGDSVDRGEQRVWFKKILSDAKNKGMHVICLVHQPVQHIPEYKSGFQCLDFTPKAEKTSYEWHYDVQDFIKDGGNFVTWLCGHQHDDRFGVVKSFPDQLQICIDTAGSKRQKGTRWDTTGKFDRIENTINDDLFDIVSVNTRSKKIVLYRIGCHFDKFGRRIESVCYDYGNNELIFP